MVSVIPLFSFQRVPDRSGDPQRPRWVPEHQSGDIRGQISAGEQDPVPPRIPPETPVETAGE